MQDLISHKSKANIIPINRTQNNGVADIIQAINKTSSHFSLGKNVDRKKYLSKMIYRLELLNVQQDDLILVLGAQNGHESAVLASMGAKVITVSTEKFEILKSINKIPDNSKNRIQIFSDEEIVQAGSLAPFDKIIIAPQVKNIPAEFFGLLSINGDMVISSDETANPTILHVKRKSAEHFDTKKKTGLVDRSVSYDVFDI